MKKLTKLFLIIIVCLLSLTFFSDNKQFIKAAPNGVYFDVEVNESSMAGELLPVDIYIRNIESLPIEFRSIESIMTTLYFDSSKYSLPIAASNEIDKRSIINTSSIALGPELIDDNVRLGDIFCKIPFDNPDYLEIEIPYMFSSDKTLNSSGKLITLYFNVLDDAIGVSDFYMNDETDLNYSSIWYSVEDYPTTIEFNEEPKTVVVSPSNNTNIKSIIVTDQDNQTYNANYINGNYEVIVPIGTSEVNIDAEASFSLAKLEGEGIKQLLSDRNEFLIKVIAQDNVTIKEHKLIVRFISNDNNLQEIKLKNATFSNYETSFTLDISTTYDLVINYTNSFTLEMVLNSQYANILGGNSINVSLEVGVSKEVIVEVIAENNDKKIYTFNFTMLAPIDNTNVKYIKTSINDTPQINDTTYTFSFPYSSAKQVNIIVLPEDPTVTVKFEGLTSVNNEGVYTSSNINLNVGVRIVKVILTTVSGKSTTYTVVFSKAAISKDSSLSEIKINGTAIPNFNPQVTNYSIGYLDSSLSSINIEAIPNYQGAIVSGSGNVNLKYGPNSIIITIKSEVPLYNEVQTETKYILTYARVMPSNNNVDEIIINGTALVNFSKDVLTYNVNLGKQINNAIIEVTLNEDSKNANLSGNIGYNILNYGLNTFVVQVTSETNNIIEYTIYINREQLSKDVSLTSLEVNGNILHNIDDTFYSEVLYSVDIVNINAVCNDINSTIIGTGIMRISNIGENVFVLKVIAEDGQTYKEYNIIVNRLLPSNDNFLSNLEIDTEGLIFDKNKNTYSLKVDWNVLNVTVNAKAQSENARVLPSQNDSIEKVVPLNFGTNKIFLDIEAEDKSIRTYTILIDRQFMYSNDASLKEIYIEGYDPFTLKNGDEYIDKFNLIVPHSQEEVKFKVIANSEKANIIGATSKTLNDGVNEFLIYVFAEDDSYKIYTVIVIREPLSSNNRLSNIIIEGYEDINFDPNIEQYTLQFKEKITKLNINPIRVDELAKVEINGADILQTGINSVTIDVTAQDDTVRTYTLFVVVEEVKEVSEPLNLWFIAFLIILPVTILFGIVLVIKTLKLKQFL